MEFLAGFDFVREAGTAGEVKAAKMIRDTLDSFGAKNWMEEFDFWGFRINRAVLKVMEDLLVSGEVLSPTDKLQSSYLV